MPYLTPTDNLSPSAVRRVISIPAHYSHIVSGALFDLTFPSNFEQLGDDTPEQAAEKMFQVWWEFITNMGYIGTVVPFVTATPPAGILECDGSTYLREDYPLLYAALDAAFIIDADTFSVPDLRNRTVVGAGGLYSVADEFGAAEHTLTIAEMPEHRHPSHIHAVSSADPVAGVPLPSPDLADADWTGNEGGGNPHNNIQPSTALRMGVIEY